MRLNVDSKGNPWFSDGPRRFLLSPKQDLLYRTMGRFQDLAFVDGKDMIACDRKYLVSPQLSEDRSKMEHGVPVMDFIAMMKLDHGDCRLFDAGPDKFYVVLRDGAKSRDEVTLVTVGDEKPRIRKFLRVAGPRLVAVAGDGDVTYYAEGKSIYEFKAGDDAPTRYFEASAPVKSLAYSESAGLFYATTQNVGFVSATFQMTLISSPDPQIALRGSDLYVRLGKSLAVLKISGADQLKTLAWADKK